MSSDAKTTFDPTENESVGDKLMGTLSEPVQRR